MYCARAGASTIKYVHQLAIPDQCTVAEGPGSYAPLDSSAGFLGAPTVQLSTTSTPYAFISSRSV
jgi:hypothetical protein